MIPTPREDKGNHTNISCHMCVTVSPAPQSAVVETGPETEERFKDCISDIPYFYDLPTTPSFENPTDEHPMKVAEFLNKLDLSGVISTLEERYKNIPKHFHFPPEAMIKALVFKYLKGLRWDSRLVRYLNEYPDEAKLLGFDGVHFPSQQVFSHFITSRQQTEGLYDIFDGLVLEITKELAKHDLTLGRNVSIDSTPLKALRNDPDARGNGHYKIYGYKIHGAVDIDFNIPLVFNFTPADVGDAPEFPKLLDRIDALDIKVEKALADGAYASSTNFAIAEQRYRTRVIFNMRENAKIRKEGTPRSIKKCYDEFWKVGDYKPDASLDYMLAFLMLHDKMEVVGAYFWNRHLHEWEKKPDEIQKEYNERGTVERFHSVLKQQLNIEKFNDKQNIDRVENHVLMCYISLLCVALCRVQNGITEGLIQTCGLI